MAAERIGAAMRRWDRQLRAFRRHELLTVRMESAAAFHQSAQRVEGPGEGEVHEKHDGPRAQKRPLPRTRSEPLVEVSEPQVGAVTVGYVAAPRRWLAATLQTSPPSPSSCARLTCRRRRRRRRGGSRRGMMR